MKLTIPFKLPSLNEYINKLNRNRYVGSKFKKDVELDICWQIKLQRLKPITKPCMLIITWQEANRRRDIDNVYSASKYILDSLQTIGVLPTDGAKWVKGISNEIKYGKEYLIEVEIKEIE